MAVTRKVRDKGASTVQHVGSETGWIDTPGKLQVIRKAKPEDKSIEGRDDEGTIRLCYRELNVRYGVHPIGYQICSRSGELVHEQSQQGALERGQVDTLVLEGHLEHVPPIRLR